jgi:hypothetical protein
MKVLVGCEFSGVVRDAFRRLGHEAWSCDLLHGEGDNPEYHIKGDVRELLVADRWDLGIFHPPCTFLASSGIHWNSKDAARKVETEKAVEFFRLLLEAPIPRICVENPVGVISTRIRKPDLIIQPWQFGHDESKRTCLWLKNLPPLKATHIIHYGAQKVMRYNQTASGQNNIGSKKDRWKERAITYKGIADAMAQQWGVL